MLTHFQLDLVILKL